MDFAVIERSGLTQGEFGQLLGVSRVTVSQWVRSKMAPHRFHEAKVKELLAALELAIKNDALPIPNARVPARMTLIEPIVRAAIASNTGNP
jgi:predicted transcriptional regulator